jgi:(p)ppGpp synthase/HD superfamily hydrolase
VPGYWKYKNGKSEEDEIKDNKKDVRALNHLLRASRKIESSDQLLTRLMNDCVAKITTEVEDYNPEE